MESGMELLRVIGSSASNVSYDPHVEPHHDVTAGQLAFATIWAVCTITWLFRYNKYNNSEGSEDTTEHQRNAGSFDKDIRRDEESPHSEKNETTDVDKALEINDLQQGIAKKTVSGSLKACSVAKPPPSFQQFLKSFTLFGLLMFYFYLCDYRKIFPKLERVYNRDEFLFLVFLLFLIASFFTIKSTKDKILNRDQTEEWKGWMQVMFVWYHVFVAAEWYNWIRVYIAAYVWLTGFGNFSFFWVRKDFSIWRFLKMQFRLNFLVTCLCVVTSNEYMLYYICAMHSYWFISVYVFMCVFKSWNTDSKKMLVKFAIYFIANLIIFEIRVVTDNIFKPFGFLLAYTDPRFEPLHEWVFRAGLDHWACFFGMVCAYNYPHFENFMNYIDKSSYYKKTVARVGMITICILVLAVWYKSVMTLDKYKYNTFHPYTSIIPILCFIILRNSFPVLRSHYIGMFAWLGKITLETYLSQLHIYLQSNAKHFIGYLPEYHFLNFTLATLIYLPVSYMLFNLTTDFSAYLLPNNFRLIMKNVGVVCIAFLVPYLSFTVYLSV